MVQEAIDSCSDVLGSEENNLEALCDRAEAYIANEQFDEGE